MQQKHNSINTLKKSETFQRLSFYPGLDFLFKRKLMVSVVVMSIMFEQFSAHGGVNTRCCLFCLFFFSHIRYLECHLCKKVYLKICEHQ